MGRQLWTDSLGPRTKNETVYYSNLFGIRRVLHSNVNPAAGCVNRSFAINLGPPLYANAKRILTLPNTVSFHILPIQPCIIHED